MCLLVLRKTSKVFLGQTVYWPRNWHIQRRVIAGASAVLMFLMIIMMMMMTQNEAVYWKLKYNEQKDTARPAKAIKTNEKKLRSDI